MDTREPGFLCEFGDVTDGFDQSASAVYRMIADGYLPAVRLGSSPNAPARVPAAELEERLFVRKSDAPQGGCGGGGGS
jgi:hypothetical protein